MRVRRRSPSPHRRSRSPRRQRAKAGRVPRDDDAALAWALQAQELGRTSVLGALSLQARDFGPEDYETLIALDEHNVRVGVRGDLSRVFRKCEPVDYPCSICLTAMRTDRVQLCACGHAFHEKCIRGWLKDNHTCPIDKKQVD